MIGVINLTSVTPENSWRINRVILQGQFASGCWSIDLKLDVRSNQCELGWEREDIIHGSGGGGAPHRLKTVRLGIQYTYTYVKKSEHHQFELDTQTSTPFSGINGRTTPNGHTTSWNFHSWQVRIRCEHIYIYIVVETSPGSQNVFVRVWMVRLIVKHLVRPLLWVLSVFEVVGVRGTLIIFVLDSTKSCAV